MPATLQRLIRRPATERGFTLIELLVVIIILGILAAVVVFAVSGVGDKGKSAATTIDERTIRTAEEAYCARNGTYASGQELVDGGFLSELPKYHQVDAQQGGGSCNGWKFTVLRTAQADPYPPGKWDLIEQPTALGGAQFLVRLPNGTILVGGYATDGTTAVAQIWDPTKITGGWTTIDTPPYGSPNVSGNSNGAILLSDDPATPANECRGITNNCGKVFVFGKYLFNPNESAGQTPPRQWESIDVNPYTTCEICQGGSRNFTYVQLKGNASQCGSNCGKVVIFSAATSAAPPTGRYDVWDPKDNTYMSFPYPGPGTTAGAGSVEATNSQAVQLTNGKVLLCCFTDYALPPAGVFFDPLTLSFSAAPVATPPARYWRTNNPQPPPVLPDGSILFGSEPGDAPPRSTGLYIPDPAGGPGTWSKIASCVPDGLSSPRNCLPLGTLADGRVLTIRSSNTYPVPSSTHQVWVYNPASKIWTQNPTRLNNRFSYDGDAVLLDHAGGACGNHCGKVLIVGRGASSGAIATAELYTP